MSQIYPLSIEQNATFTRTFTVKDSNGNPIDLTGATAKVQIKQTYDSPSSVATYTTGAGITMGGAAGTIVLTITAAQTAAMPNSLVGVWDLLITWPDTTKQRLVRGTATVSPGVTN